MLRWILVVLLSLVAALFWWLTLTVPIITATTPALLALAFSMAVIFVWRGRRRSARS